MQKPCSIPDCDRKTVRLKKGMCLFHYERQRQGISFDAPIIRKAREGTIKYGYLLVPVNGKQIPYHRIVMEKNLGRPLDRNEVVHHIDGNKLNNSPENLEVIASQGEHFKRHWAEWKKDGTKAKELGEKFSAIQIARWKRWKADPELMKRQKEQARKNGLTTAARKKKLEEIKESGFTDQC